jgi:uncharacterized protein YicC (UPF0701 family)
MEESVGSIMIAGEIDRVKGKVVKVMNRVPKDYDQIFGRKIISMLSEMEREVNEWLQHTDDSSIV